MTCINLQTGVFQGGFVKFLATIVNEPLLVHTLGQSLEALSSQLQ